MVDDRAPLIQRLAEAGVTGDDWIGMDEMAADALKLLLESVEQHREMWVLPNEGPEQAHDHQHDHAPGEPHQHEHEHEGPQ